MLLAVTVIAAVAVNLTGWWWLLREQNSRNKKRREIKRALAVLEDAGRLRRETRQAARGRSAELWIPVLTPPPDASATCNFVRFFRTSSPRQPSRARRRRRSPATDVNPAQLRHVHKPPAHKATPATRWASTTRA
jgi:hypothetical protein